MKLFGTKVSIFFELNIEINLMCPNSYNLVPEGT